MNKRGLADLPIGNVVFHLLLIFTVVFIFLTNPFLHIPFDMWHHLIALRGIYDEDRVFLFNPQQNANLLTTWHHIWAFIFKTLAISDTLRWARIIHLSQFLLSFVLIYGSAKIFLSLILKNRGGLAIKYLAFFSFWVWLFGVGTYSVGHQQSWMMWYSVTYQITTPLYFYLSALLAKLFFGDDLGRRDLLYLFLAFAAGVALLAKIHPSELFYLLLFSIFLAFFNVRRVAEKVLRHKRQFLLVALLLFVSIFLVDLDVSAMLRKSFSRLATLDGLAVFERDLSALSRVRSTHSELLWFSLLLGMATVALTSASGTISSIIDRRILTTVYFIALMFALLPAIPYLRVLPAIVMQTHTNWRLVLGSHFFLFVPVFLFAAYSGLSTRKNVVLTGLTGFIFLVLLVVLSKLVMTGALYGNVWSVMRSFEYEKVGPHYSRDDIDRLGRIIEDYEHPDCGADCIYYLRGDLAYLARAVLGKYVYQYRLTQPIYSEKFIDVDVPADFPKHEAIFERFSFDKLYLSERVEFQVDEPEFSKGGALFHLDTSKRGRRRDLHYLEGWGLVEDEANNLVLFDKIFIYLRRGMANKGTVFTTSPKTRVDLKIPDRIMGGFQALIRGGDIGPGKFEVHLIGIKDGKRYLFDTSRTLTR